MVGTAQERLCPPYNSKPSIIRMLFEIEQMRAKSAARELDR